MNSVSTDNKVGEQSNGDVANNQKEFDDEPVFYCRRCLSLKIREIPMVCDQGYCDDCGTVDVGTASIEEWKKMYEEKYGHPYIVKRELKWPYWC